MSTRHNAVRFTLSCSIVLLFTSSIFAAVWRYWDVAPPNEASWAGAANWVNDRRPGAGEYACIDNGGTAVLYDQQGGLASKLFIGYGSTADGTVKVEAGGTLTLSNSYIGYNNTGSFIQNGGQVDHSSTLNVGNSEGSYELNGGTLTSNYLYLGNGGQGTFTQSGGTYNTGGHVYLGKSGGNGNYTLNGGSLVMTGEGTNEVSVKVGDGAGSSGVLKIGDAISTGAISTTAGTSGGTAGMEIRTAADATGLVEGYGNVALTGTLLNNGKVVANGYGQDRTLDMSSFAAVTITDDLRNDKPGSDGTNGWYAVSGGKLALPTITLAGASSGNWGENNEWSGIDAVNSFRIYADENVVGGNVDVALLATDRTDVDVSALDAVLGIWQVSADGFDFGTGEVGMDIRYDDVLAASLGITEDELQVLIFDGADWVNVTSSVNSTDNRIHSIGLSGATDVQVAVGIVPEPATLTLLCAAGFATVLRRRK